MVFVICVEEQIFRNLAVDHNHKTGKVRRLLCTSCNTGLGQFRDDPALLRKAAEYVEQEFDLPDDIEIKAKNQDDKRRWRNIIKTPAGTFSSAEAASLYYNVGPTTIGIWCGMYDYYPTGKKQDGFEFEKVFMSMNEIKENYNVEA